MKPKSSTLVFLFVTAVLFAAAAIAYHFYPPVVQFPSPELDALTKRQRDLAPFTEARLKKTADTLAAAQRDLWTTETLQFFIKNNVPEGWVSQNLGEGSTKHFRTVRYAFQRPGAIANHYPEFAALVRAIETAQSVSLQTVNLGTYPGYQGSRRFNQMSVIATFYLSQ